MTIPPVIRIFFAIDLPLPAKEKLGTFINLLKKTAKTNAIRWTKPENLHITLQFLAEVKTEHLTTLIDNVKEKISGITKQAQFNITDLHLFPNPYRPRVIVLNLLPQEELAFISAMIGEGIEVTKYEKEKRPFRAHLTLGRLKRTKINLNFLKEALLPDIEPIHVEEIILFRSEPEPEGSKYTIIDRIKLITY